MIEFLDTAVTIYLVGCPIMTLFFILIGYIELEFVRTGKTRLRDIIHVITKIIILLYFGWLEVFKKLYRQYKGEE